MFEIRYHKNIPEDVSRLGALDRKRIQKAIEEKLAIEPMPFSKPLSESLRGFRSLRVGDVRVVFLIQKTEIFIVIIAHRSVVYKLAEKRT